MAGDNSAGQVCAVCEQKATSNPCLSWVNVTITDGDGEKYNTIVYGGQTKKFYVSDKSVLCTNPLNKLTFFPGSGGASQKKLEFSSSESKAASVKLVVTSKCSKAPKTCPNSIWVPQDLAKGNSVNFNYTGKIPYKLSAANLNIDAGKIATDLVKGNIDSLKNLLAGLFFYKYTLHTGSVHNTGGKLYVENKQLMRSDTAISTYLPVMVNVFPYIEIGVRFGFSADRELSDTLTDKDKKNIKLAEYKAKYPNKRFNPSNSKQMKQARSGWTKVDKLKDKNEFKWFVGGFFQIGATDLTVDSEKESEKFSAKVKSLTGGDKVHDLVKSLIKPKNSAKSPLTLGISLPSLELQLGAALRHNRTFTGMAIEAICDVKFEPLFAIKATFDLIQVLCLAIPALEKPIGKLRSLAESGKNVSLSVKCDLSIEASLNIGIRASYLDAFKIELSDANIKVTPELDLELEGSAKTAIASGAFKAGMNLQAELVFAVQKNTQNKIELIYYHEGISFTIIVAAAAGLGSQSFDLDEDGGSGEFKWDLMDPLPKENAYNLYTFS